MKAITAKEFWKLCFFTYPQNTADELAVAFAESYSVFLVSQDKTPDEHYAFEKRISHIATTKSGSLIFAEPPSISRPERQTYRVEIEHCEGKDSEYSIWAGLELRDIERIIRHEKIEWKKEGVVL